MNTVILGSQIVNKPYSELTLAEKVDFWNKQYECECSYYDPNYGCADCQNTGYTFDSIECDIILSLDSELQKAIKLLVDSANGLGYYGEKESVDKIIDFLKQTGYKYE
jgi:hypothetical protein